MEMAGSGKGGRVVTVLTLLTRLRRYAVYGVACLMGDIAGFIPVGGGGAGVIGEGRD